MHKLSRPSREPTGLAEARASLSSWDDLPRRTKQAIQEDLLLMQECRCAYCECAIDRHKGHIEHFRRKASSFFPKMTFAWDNLFYSCMRPSSCGKHKDAFVKSKDDCIRLIDPAKEDPERFFAFGYDGTISVRQNLSPVDENRAKFTLAAFHLDDPKLTQERKNVLAGLAWMKQEKLTLKEIKSLHGLASDIPYITCVANFFGKDYQGIQPFLG